MDPSTTLQEEAEKFSAGSEEKEEEPTHAESELSKGTPPKRDNEESIRRYAALRNHRIRFEDAIDPNAERVNELHNDDIVFGRGRGFQNHPGNLRMRRIIEKYKRQYHTLKRSDKRILVEKVYNELVKDGARFLKKLDNDDAWVKVDVPIALQKVSHTLRCRKSVEKLLHDVEKSGVITPRSGVIRNTMVPGLNLGNAQVALQNLAQSPALPLGMLPSYAPLIGADAMQLAALSRQRALGGMMPMIPHVPLNAEYYNILRQDQLLRDTMLLQQMADTKVPKPSGNEIPEDRRGSKG